VRTLRGVAAIVCGIILGAVVWTVILFLASWSGLFKSGNM